MQSTTYSQVYKAYQARIVREGVLKSAIFGLIAGLGVAAIIAFATIFTEFNGMWTALGAGFGVAVVSALVLYFVMFRPTEKRVAERLDRQGFDERIITMMELDGDSSVMAGLQRNEAVTAVTSAVERNGGRIPTRSTTPMEKLRSLGLTVPVLIVTCVVVVFAVVSLVLTTLPTTRVKEIFTGVNTYNVTYNAGEHGYILAESNGYAYDSEIARVGKYSMKVDEGKYGESIVVVAHDDIEDAYMFAGWSDGYADKYNAAARTEKVYAGITATAQYIKMDVVEDDPEEGIGQGGEKGLGMGGGDAPPKDGADESKSYGGGGGMAPPNKNPSASASDSVIYSEIIDGNTDYQEYFQQYYEEAMDRLANGEDIPESLRKLIAAYFEALK